MPFLGILFLLFAMDVISNLAVSSPSFPLSAAKNPTKNVSQNLFNFIQKIILSVLLM